MTVAKERAVELVLDAMKKPHVGNPFAYAEEKLEKQALAEDLGAPIQETSEEFARRNAAKVR